MADIHRDDTNLKVFNTAKVYAEQVLFPKMFLYQTYQRQADFGAENLQESLELSEDIKDIQRFNGLKGMAETTFNLLINISSTVRLKGNNDEIKQLDKLLEYLKNLKRIFYENKQIFFNTIYKNNTSMELLNREQFEKIKNNVNICYINTEILMTRNKLLFADANDEYLSDKEILDNIKKEYIEG